MSKKFHLPETPSEDIIIYGDISKLYGDIPKSDDDDITILYGDISKLCGGDMIREYVKFLKRVYPEFKDLIKSNEDWLESLNRTSYNKKT